MDVEWPHIDTWVVQKIKNKKTAGAPASRSFPLVGRFCNVPNKRRSRVSQAHEIMDSIARWSQQSHIRPSNSREMLCISPQQPPGRNGILSLELEFLPQGLPGAPGSPRASLN